MIMPTISQDNILHPKTGTLSPRLNRLAIADVSRLIALPKNKLGITKPAVLISLLHRGKETE
jgi:hypothetical protein